MFSRRLVVVLAVLLLLVACVDSALHLNVRFHRVDGLQSEDSVVFRGQRVGNVDSVGYVPEGVFEAAITIDGSYRAVATSRTHFTVAADPARPGRKCIEMDQFGTGGDPLADGSTVEGGEGFGGFPLGDVLQGMGEGLRQFTDQMEGLRRGLEKLPQSEEAKKLESEWQRLLEQLQQSGKTLEKEWEPRLREQMQDLDKRFRELEPKSPPKPDPAPVPAPAPRSRETQI